MEFFTSNGVWGKAYGEGGLCNLVTKTEQHCPDCNRRYYVYGQIKIKSPYHLDY